MTDSLKNLVETWNYFSAEINRLAEKYQQVVPQEAKPIFSLLPNVRITWRQYIPGFNDGDPCVFTLTDPQIGRTDLDDESDLSEHEYDAWTIQYAFEHNQISYLTNLAAMGVTSDNKDEVINAIKDFCKMFQLEIFFERAFGVNVQVTIYPSGSISIDDYDCGY